MGILGAGGRARAIALHFHKPADNARVVAATDLRPDAFGWLEEKIPGLSTFTDVDRFLASGINAVLVTSPDRCHADHAVAALKAGLAVYLEKPMAITIPDCDRILAAAAAADLPLFVGHNMRYMPLFRKMKELIDQGVIGEVRSIWCRHFINYGGDAYFRGRSADRRESTSLLLQKGSHDIDVIHWLAGATTTRVTGMGNLTVYNRCPPLKPGEKADQTWRPENWPPLAQSGFNPVMDVEDHSMVLMQMTKDIQACYLQCHYTPDSCRNYSVIGTEGRIENLGHFSHSRIRVWAKRTKENWDWAHGDYDVYTADRPEGGHGGSDPRIAQEFIRYLREGGETTATPLAARNAVAVGCLATESMRNGCVPLDVPVVSYQ